MVFDVSLGHKEVQATFQNNAAVTTSLLSEGEIRGLMEMLGTLNSSLLSLQETGRNPIMFLIWFNAGLGIFGI